MSDNFLSGVMKYAVIGGIIYIGYVASITLNYMLRYRFVNEHTQEYVEKNLDNIIASTEKRFGIHFGKINVGFKDTLQNGNLGIYLINSDSIYIARKQNTPYFQASDVQYAQNPEFPLRKVKSTVEGTVIHEAGHDYFFQLAEAFKKETNIMWMANIDMAKGNEKLPTFRENFNKKFIEEGVSEYLAISSGQESPRDTARIANSDNFMNLDEKAFTNEFYSRRYLIVKPILDSLGIKKGIRAILAAGPIIDSDVWNVNAYSKRVLEKHANASIRK